MRTRLALIAVAAVVIAACSGLRGDGPPSRSSDRVARLPADAVPRPEAMSKYGNGPVYEVFGKRYTVMPTSRGYRQRGVASWYGKKFHGNLTSNREVYDMYEMTAAHKTLPLPSYVRVRNLRNNRSVVVRVNDRGPFVHNRIIDLSYSAARKLDMLRDGTSLVEVTAISLDDPPGDRPARRTIPPAPAATVAADPEPVENSGRIFVQVGAFGDRGNAERRLAMLASQGIENARILEDPAQTPPLLRIRVGPLDGVMQYDLLVEELAGIGITDPYLVVE